jgi:hypothetical protein
MACQLCIDRSWIFFATAIVVTGSAIALVLSYLTKDNEKQILTTYHGY